MTLNDEENDGGLIKPTKIASSNPFSLSVMSVQTNQAEAEETKGEVANFDSACVGDAILPQAQTSVAAIFK